MSRSRPRRPDSPRATRATTALPLVRRLRFSHHLTQATMARLLGVSLRTVTKLEKEGAAGPLPRSAVEVQRLLEALSGIMHPEHVGTWLTEKNDAFQGAKPLELIEAGELDRVWALVHHVGSGEPL